MKRKPPYHTNQGEYLDAGYRACSTWTIMGTVPTAYTWFNTAPRCIPATATSTLGLVTV